MSVKFFPIKVLEGTGALHVDGDVGILPNKGEQSCVLYCPIFPAGLTIEEPVSDVALRWDAFLADDEEDEEEAEEESSEPKSHDYSDTRCL